MGFSEDTNRALAAKLSERHVRHRQAKGKTLSYVEGWHTIAEANRIFGYDAWNRQTMSLKCVSEIRLNDGYKCSYLAKVRVTVRAGDVTVCREGTGAGHAAASEAGEAHEMAAKEAETDAMKRALVTFGNPFGLALYDPHKRNVRRLRRAGRGANGKDPLPWVLIDQDGERRSAFAKPVDFLAAMRRQIDVFRSAKKVESFIHQNRKMLDTMLEHLPDLKSGSGTHYVSLVSRYAARKAKLLESAEASLETGAPEKEEPSGKAPGPMNVRADCTRARDKDYLRHVASLPCLVCSRAPCQAHHVRHAQPRALGLKVGDQWTVPLCSRHHRALHDSGAERDWWADNRIDAVAIAKRIWQSKVSTPE